MKNENDKSINKTKSDYLKMLGERIKYLRIKNGMTQDRLAQMAGYTSRSTINKMEKGLIDISQSKFIKIAHSLSVSPAQLIGSREAWGDMDRYRQDIDYSLTAVKDKSKAEFYLKIKDQAIEAELNKITISIIINYFETMLYSLDEETNN